LPYFRKERDRLVDEGVKEKKTKRSIARRRGKRAA